MQEKILEKIGLSPVESKIYLTLLQIGPSLAGGITKESKINRTLVYDAIERLIKKGMVSFIIKANRKYFEATNPHILFSKIKEKESEIRQIKKEIPELISNYKLTKSKQGANIYQGKKGIKSIFEDILRERKDYVVFGAEGRFKEFLPYYYIHYQKRKKRLKIKTKAIFNEKSKNKEAVKEFIGNAKFIPQEYSSPATTFIYNNKAAIIIWLAEPIGILIESRETSESYKNYFKLMWGIAKA